MTKYKIKEIDALSDSFCEYSELEEDADIKHLNSLSKNEQDEYLELKQDYYEYKDKMIFADGELSEFEIKKKFPSEVERIKLCTGSSNSPVRDKDLFNDTNKKLDEVETLIKERDEFYKKNETDKMKKKRIESEEFIKNFKF